MRRKRRALPILLLALALGLSLATEAHAQRRGSRGLWGDWVIEQEFNGRTYESILAFGRGADGERTARWISFWGSREVKDLKIEDGAVSFSLERRGRDGNTVTSTFEGKLADGKLSGVLTRGDDEREVVAVRRPRLARAVGKWNVSFQVGDRQIENTVVISQGEERQLSVDWRSDRVKHDISDVRYERGRLRFKTTSRMEDRTWESSFEGRVSRGELEGTLKSERGEIAISGKRVGAAAVGTWELTLQSERGERSQRLVVHPDMTALYGTTPVEKVELGDEGKLGFAIVLEFGEREFRLDFSGKIDGNKLTGELKSARGTTRVEGEKVIPRRRGARAERPQSETI